LFSPFGRPAVSRRADRATAIHRRGVFGVAILASIFTSYGGYGSGQHFVAGMKPAVSVGAAIVAIGALLAFAIGKRSPKTTTSSTSEQQPPNSQPPKQSADETPHPPRTAPDRSPKQALALGASARPVRPLHRSATKLRTSP
jgi:hypothetical protein